MPHGRLAALAMTAAVLTAWALGPPSGAAASPHHDRAPRALGVAKVERALLVEMNRVRVARGRPPLRSRAVLRRPARAQSRYLLRIGDLRHEGRDGAPFWARLVAAGFPRRRMMGENLALVPDCTRGAVRRAVRLWMRSPGHRANLLNRRFRWTGAGAAIAPGCASVYLTADFGS